MLDLLMPRRARLMDGGWTSGWFGSRARTNAGVVVDEELALTYSAVFRATGAIVQPLSSIPINWYKKTATDDDDSNDDDREKAKEVDDIADLLNLSPNDQMTSMPWREGRAENQVNWGSGFAEIVRDRGKIVALNPIHASRVRPGRGGEDGNYDYIVRNNDGSNVGLYADEILHIPGKFSRDGVWGRGVIPYARESIGAGIAQERFGAAFFGSGAQPKGVLSTKGLKNKEDRTNFRREWREVHSSPDSSEVMIVPDGSTYVPISLSNEVNQFLQSRMFSRSEIANWYDLPHYMLGEKESAANVEQKGIEFVIYSLRPWATRQEQQYAFKLLLRSQFKTIYCQHDFRDLLRGDIQTRYNAYRVAITSGFMTINQALRLEHQNGIGPAGDVNYVPLNQTTAERMMEGDQAAPGSRPGSDHTGAPADSPLDHEAQFHAFAKTLTKMQRINLAGGVKYLRAALPERKVDYKAIARLTLVDTLGRFYARESKDVAVEAKKGKDFDNWLREYYAKHQAFMVGCLKPTCAVLGLAGVKKWDRPEALAAWLKMQSLDAIKASYGRDSLEVFLRKLEAWPTKRVEIVADEIMLCGGVGGTPGPCPDNTPEEDADPEEALQDKRDAEDEKISDERDAEDLATETARDDEDAEIGDARDKEDAKIDSNREKEDAALVEAREAEDKEVAEAIEAEDKALEIAREKEDAEIEKADNERSESRESEDQEIQDKRDAEDEPLSDAREKEDQELSDRQQKESDEADAANEKNIADLDARDAPQEDYDAEEERFQKESLDLANKWRDETSALDDSREKEDKATDSSREKEDKAIKSKREKEDAATEKKAESLEKSREKADTKRESDREKTESKRDSEREKEDTAIEKSREKEDAHKESKREKEDSRLQAQRDKEDAEREAKRKKEDHELAKERAKESAKA